MKKDVVERAIFTPSRADHHAQAFDRPGLADKVIELGRPQRGIERAILTRHRFFASGRRGLFGLMLRWGHEGGICSEGLTWQPSVLADVFGHRVGGQAFDLGTELREPFFKSFIPAVEVVKALHPSFTFGGERGEDERGGGT